MVGKDASPREPDGFLGLTARARDAAVTSERSPHLRLTREPGRYFVRVRKRPARNPAAATELGMSSVGLSIFGKGALEFVLAFRQVPDP